MTSAAGDLLEHARTELAPGEEHNRLVPAIDAGTAPLAAIGAFAVEELALVPSDRRSFLALAAAAAEPATADFFADLGKGENIVLGTLPALAEAGGFDAAARRSYRRLAGCQAYPSYLAWLALNADPAAVVLAVTANFAAWGGYCATLAQALRREYGLPDGACGFVDFFATPAPDLERLAEQAIQQALDGGKALDAGLEYGRMLQEYELMFWNTLADAHL
ncbi:transcriptional regulator [Dactylosporangium vinaceum]|uniref:Transcriptional regulator n=1 Tax=Dactylosporangium vinaceum TaxID=53362 RepID=A0ABV5MKK3_9ACTN|nr:hypothetical protein [Dactylosporangium vinaceum]UAB94154.1 transcriptional regulator [Dactylosporangium vinaceum]